MQLEVNAAYAGHGECFAREVISIEKGQVSYRDFVLHDGAPMASFRTCSRAVFRKWISRPCTEAEIARFRRDEMPRDDQRFEDVVMSQSFLDTASFPPGPGLCTQRPHALVKKKPRTTTSQREMAKIFAMIVRNAMEDFHVKHLSDAQMKELNPIIRDAICTGFHMIENLSSDTVKAYYDFQKMLIPDFWEEPELLDGYARTVRL